MRRIAVLIGGGALLLVGVALLVLPGPGFLLIFGGLLILSTEFAWARKYVDTTREKAQQGVDEVTRSTWRTVVAAVFGLGMIVVGLLPFFGIEVPLLSRFTGGVVVASGLVLLGTLVYARRSGSSAPDVDHPPRLRSAADARACLPRAGSPTGTTPDPALPGSYRDTLQRTGPLSIDRHFVLLPAPQPLADGGWHVADAGLRGRWLLLSADDGHHMALHPGPGSRIEHLPISFEEWLRIAVLARDMHGWRKAYTGEGMAVDLGAHVRSELDRIRPGLAEAHPVFFRLLLR